jgi:SAM-dependent methyltransferase
VIDRHVLDFCRSSLPAPPARVLEVGAGAGELAAELRDAGYEVVAVDPSSDAPGVVPAALLDVDEPAQSFDAAVAVVSLHHVEPLPESCAHLAELLRPAGVLVVDEFDVERFDESAARWWSGHHADHPDPGETVAGVRDHLHPVAAIRDHLERWFELSDVSRGPYLYRFQLSEELRPEEERSIAAGVLRANGARFTGRRKS